MLKLDVQAMQQLQVENSSRGEYVYLDTSNLPESVNWVDQGAVTTPKDQGTCGSCWTFASTGMMEAAYKKASGNLVTLSEQQILDCATEDQYASGCSGGAIFSGLEFYVDNYALTGASMPYQGVAATCTQDDYMCHATQAKVVDWNVVPFANYSGDQMKAAIQVNPVGIAVNANNYF